MSVESDFDPDPSVQDVIASLLRLVLGAREGILLDKLFDDIASSKGYVDRLHLRWSELSEGERNAVAVDVGLVARAALGTGSATVN